jgi:hypothetical protein
MHSFTVNWIGVTGGLRDPECRTPRSPELRLLAPETGGGRFDSALDPFANFMEQRISVQMGVAGCRMRLPVTKDNQHRGPRGLLSRATQKPCWGKCWGMESCQEKSQIIRIQYAEFWRKSNCQAACRIDHFWPLGRGRWLCFEWEWKRSQGSERQFDGESFWAEG